MNQSLYKLLTDQLIKFQLRMMEAPLDSAERWQYRELCREIEMRLLVAQQSA